MPEIRGKLPEEITLLESDPASKILEIIAFRNVILGERINNDAIARCDSMLIPQGTIAKAIMNIRSGGYEKDAYLTKSSHTGSVYLHAELIILEDPFSKRRIFQNIGIVGNNRTGDNDVFGTKGRSLLRGLIESAKNMITPNKKEHQIFMNGALENNDVWV